MASDIPLSDLYKAYMWDPSFKHLRAAGFHFVPGVGTMGSIMFVGEAPGEQEDRLREPFIGPSGQVLRKELDRVGINLDEHFVTNLLKYRPSLTNRYPTPQETKASLLYLTEEVNSVNPYLIVLLGRTPSSAFYPGKHFSAELCGKLLDRRGRKIMVTWHPAATLHNPGLLPDFRRHIAMIKEVVDGHNNGSDVDQ